MVIKVNSYEFKVFLALENRYFYYCSAVSILKLFDQRWFYI